MKKLFFLTITIFVSTLSFGADIIEIIDQNYKVGDIYYNVYYDYYTGDYSASVCGIDTTIGDSIAITIPSSITVMGISCPVDYIYSLSGYNQLISVDMSNSIRGISSYAFANCSNLASVNMSDSVGLIEPGAFCRCSKLASIKVGPNFYTTVPDDDISYPFFGCTNLTSVTLNCNNYLSRNDPRECKISEVFGEQVKEYIIGDDVTHIGNSAFARCNEVVSITIGDNVESIGSGAFATCPLQSLFIPKSVTSIGVSAFSPSNMTSIQVENGNTKYDSRGNCNAIIETETNTLMLGCQTTTIPDDVTSIGLCAFAGCSNLTSITIPASVSGIRGMAFAFCTGLKSVTCLALTPPEMLREDGVYVVVFNGINRSTITLYVPAESVVDYLSAEEWRDFDIKVIDADNLPEVLTNEGLNDGKFIRDNKVFILREGKTYDMQGIEVK